ncbi:MAG: SGNH/GDSL hydrolase family protein [Edaphobacter sp.]|uniref:SGNH/GDSL hydrolase family protein n=1 Tax=Edaphobacter sp. TaxID=1934404 RepID=UPI00239DC37C|nr:SGNH/GDSL hydrolase family protein [Edaphobacter sp.]MDE1178134.1 SGNH/GDSL hydrolase family protein [Edaphobacter sp.]
MFVLRSVFLAATVGVAAACAGQTPVAGAKAAQSCSCEEMRGRLNDWAQLNHYRAANERLEAPKDGEQRVVFFGSSTTENWGSKFGSVFFPGEPYVNRGVSGQTTPQMLIRFQQDVVALKPAAVVIFGGSNDVAGNTGQATLPMIEDNLRSMVAIAKANGIKVILASQQPTIDYPWNHGTHPEQALRALSLWEKNYAAENGLVYVDYYSALVGPDGGFKPGLSVDGVHPTAQGYAVMAPLAEEAIREALAGGKK